MKATFLCDGFIMIEIERANLSERCFDRRLMQISGAQRSATVTGISRESPWIILARLKAASC